ncbi:MAG TPA: glycoside hydrolase family 127 protein [Treponema sp.]|nr:glycoside hydrolase family 127 protein [Treponema sp.]
MNTMHSIPLKKIAVTDGFWKDQTQLVVDAIIPYQWKALNNEVPGAPASHAVENFKISAGESGGSPKGTIFQDSDVAKWIEAASYGLYIKSDPKLESRIDELVRLIAKSQRPDGYVNTYFIAAGLEKRWSDMTMGHELYCAGHMIEAAVAYYSATGKRDLLDVMKKYADYIGEVFGPGKGQNHSFDGHPEIELALNRLAEATGEKKYAALANHFIDARGYVKDFHLGEAAMDGMIPKSKWFLSDYYLADKPVREMTAVEGHSVRATYLYCAMADYYRGTGDGKILEALKNIWKNAVSKNMYLTAALGSQSHGERFTIDYDLPNDTCYTETCASIGLALWAQRMLLIEPKGEYADVIETAMYNGILSGISLDGEKYFYVNPLEVQPSVAKARNDHAHVAVERVHWFDCACCPTNVARFIASIGGYIATASDTSVWIHQYMSSDVNFNIGGTSVRVSQKTEYPWEGSVSIKISPESPVSFTLNIRIPAWCVSSSITLNGISQQEVVITNGYATLYRRWEKGDVVTLEMDMGVRLIETNANVSENAGKVAIQRGPIVYCVEEVDNGSKLHSLLVDAGVKAVASFDASFSNHSIVLDIPGFRETESPAEAPLYREFCANTDMVPCRIRAIPYYQWGNRAGGQEMRVWLRVKR